MLIIHTGLRKLSKKNVYDFHLLKMNPFEIGKPCIIISRIQLFFEKYRMDIKRDKYDIGVQNDDAINCNLIFFDFVQQTFNRMDGLYLHERIILIDTIIETEKKSTETKIRKVHPILLQK